ncbi:MAG TPA: GntR family transcriptional regulator [Chloroflexota bacterium]|nr:GntR family transcriptional regulator [Chloroflexota bacterium]
MISRKNPVLLHHQLRDILRRQIRQGVWPPQSMIPTEQQLSESYGVSRLTVRQAIAGLVDEGLLYRHQGKGTFVASPKIAHPMDSVIGLIETLQLQGRDPRVHFLGAGREGASLEVARALRLSDLDQVYHLERQVDVGGEPLYWDHTYLPVTLGVQLDAETLRAQPLFQQLEDLGYRLGEVCHQMAARAATPEEATALRVEEGTSVLTIRRTVYTDEDEPILYSRTVFRNNRFEFQIRLQRRDRSW